MNKKSILIVDDEVPVLEFLHEVLISEGFVIFKATNGKEALDILKKTPIDVTIMDLRMPIKDGIETLKSIKEHKINTQVIIMTGYATIRTAVETIKLGAYEYIVKPFENDELVKIVNSALSGNKNNYNAHIPLMDDESRLGMIGKSAAMTEIFSLLNKIALNDITLLITGESGTGKSLLAQAVHDLSVRKAFPFITINCAVLTETLLESELFGHEKGAFTGAVASRTGKFELADKGTVFLDEVSTLSFQTQAKLLRIIQDRKFERVGGEKTKEVDVRIIAATNEKLDQLVAEGKFREDLFYRLNVMNIEMPPLRKRKADIPNLVEFFIKKFNEKFNKEISGFTPEAIDLLINYSWPGNVRELENVIERAIILSDNYEIHPDCLPVNIKEHMDTKHLSGTTKNTTFSNLDNAKGQAEKEMIIEALQITDGHRAQAANLLGISRRALQYKLKKYGILDH